MNIVLNISGFNHVTEAFFQRVTPIRDFKSESFLYLRLVQNRIGRTSDLARKFFAVTRDYSAPGVAGLLRYRLREIIPAAYAFVAVMIDPASAIRPCT